jgi:hypothetical protein
MIDPLSSFKFSGPTDSGEFVELEFYGQFTVRLSRKDACDWLRVIQAVNEAGFDLRQGGAPNPDADAAMCRAWRREIERQLFDADHAN